jgi:hypothetical protein
MRCLSFFLYLSYPSLSFTSLVYMCNSSAVLSYGLRIDLTLVTNFNASSIVEQITVPESVHLNVMQYTDPVDNFRVRAHAIARALVDYWDRLCAPPTSAPPNASAAPADQCKRYCPFTAIITHAPFLAPQISPAAPPLRVGAELLLSMLDRLEAVDRCFNRYHVAWSAAEPPEGEDKTRARALEARPEARAAPLVSSALLPAVVKALQGAVVRLTPDRSAKYRRDPEQGFDEFLQEAFVRLRVAPCRRVFTPGQPPRQPPPARLERGPHAGQPAAPSSASAPATMPAPVAEGSLVMPPVVPGSSSLRPGAGKRANGYVTLAARAAAPAAETFFRYAAARALALALGLPLFLPRDWAFSYLRLRSDAVLAAVTRRERFWKVTDIAEPLEDEMRDERPAQVLSNGLPNPHGRFDELRRSVSPLQRGG